MELENCGRCGLGAVRVTEGKEYIICPACLSYHEEDEWASSQFMHRTERINAAAVAICAQTESMEFHNHVTMAELLIDAQDAATRARWAEMQKGE